MKVTINKRVEAQQWLGEGSPLPAGAHLCLPEVHWSAGRKYVCFTYADLRSKHWIDAEMSFVPPPEKANGFFGGRLTGKTKDGQDYWRGTYPFAFISIKSEASVIRDHRAVYLSDEPDDVVDAAFADYAWLEKWPEEPGRLPARAEYREVDGAFGRGFRPHYMKPGDWLLHEPGVDGRRQTRVVSDEEFTRLRAASAT